MTEYSGKRVMLLASDANNDSLIEVPVEVACMSVTVKNILDDFGGATDTPIPLHSVNSAMLEKAIAYCTHHVEHPDVTEDKHDIIPWDKDFCQVDQSTLFELLLAANYLDIKPLLDLCCKTVANMIKGKTPEEIRNVFNIKNDFTPEEEEKIRKENAWCEGR